VIVTERHEDDAICRGSALAGGSPYCGDGRERVRPLFPLFINYSTADVNNQAAKKAICPKFKLQKMFAFYKSGREIVLLYRTRKLILKAETDLNEKTREAVI